MGYSTNTLRKQGVTKANIKLAAKAPQVAASRFVNKSAEGIDRGIKYGKRFDKKANPQVGKFASAIYSSGARRKIYI